MRKLALLLILTLFFAGVAQAHPLGESEPRTYVIYVGDALLARPFTLAAMFVGAGVYLGTLPLTFYAQDPSVLEALVVAPARATFTRCMGCPFSDPVRID